MKCPKCNKDMCCEDNRADTDRGVYGDIIYFCEECGIDCDEHGDDIETWKTKGGEGK